MALIGVSQKIICPHCKKDDGVHITGMYLDTLFCECKYCGCSFPEQHLTKRAPDARKSAASKGSDGGEKCERIM